MSTVVQQPSQNASPAQLAPLRATNRTIMQMEIDPRLIEARRFYRERCRQIYQYLHNALPQLQGIQSGYTSSTSFIEGLIGDIGGRGAGW